MLPDNVLPEIKPGKRWSIIMALLGHAVNNWTDFDAFCLRYGFDPLEIPSRRLMAAVWLFLTEPMDYEQKDKLIANLFAETYEEVKQKKKKKEEPKGPKTVMAPSKDKWRAPPGWKPPGWSDEEAYKSGINFMSNKPG